MLRMQRNAMKKALSLLCALTLMVSMFVTVFAAETGDSIEENIINAPYDYPYKTGTKEWLELETIHDKIAACQIPEDILHKLSDEALVETIKNYPLAVNIYAYDTIEMGYEKVKSQFNAIEELESRVNSNDSNVLRVLEAEAGKLESRGSDADFKDCFIDTIKGCVCSQLPSDYPGDTSILSATATLTTPNGSSVPAIRSLTWNDHYISSNGQITQANVQLAHNQIQETYTSATVVSGISPKYNCHSYAWYSTSASNSYWINDPSMYILDGSYSESSYYHVGAKILYGTPGNNPEHSAIVSAVSENHLTYVTSKWGCMGVYRHLYFDSPYTSGIKKYH